MSEPPLCGEGKMLKLSLRFKIPKRIINNPITRKMMEMISNQTGLTKLNTFQSIK
jgi:hypothetical protein